jgi:hypothetical protein
MRLVLALLSVTWAAVAWGQAPMGQSIADGATFGAVATLAPLCGMRDEAWASDLRRAAIGNAGSDDVSPTFAPGSDQIVAALGYGDMEALEDFVIDSPDVTCGALRKNPALARADAAVDAFRRRRDVKPVG